MPGYEYDGGIIITASHLPYNRNGFKFFTKDGGLEKGNITDLLKRAAAAAHASGLSPASRYLDDAKVLDTALSLDPSSARKVIAAMRACMSGLEPIHCHCRDEPLQTHLTYSMTCHHAHVC